MIKIDVEGFETEVLEGAKKLLSSPLAPILCVEHCKFLLKEKSKKLFQFLCEINNYSIFRLKRGKEYPSPLLKVNKN